MSKYGTNTVQRFDKTADGTGSSIFEELLNYQIYVNHSNEEVTKGMVCNQKAKNHRPCHSPNEHTY